MLGWREGRERRGGTHLNGLSTGDASDGRGMASLGCPWDRHGPCQTVIRETVRAI